MEFNETQYVHTTKILELSVSKKKAASEEIQVASELSL